MIKGRIGEGVVNLVAKLRLDSDIYHLIKDVTVPSKNGTTQIDHVIVCRSLWSLLLGNTKSTFGIPQVKIRRLCDRNQKL